MRKTRLRLTTVMVKGKPFSLLIWPKPGSGRHRQYFSDPAEAAEEKKKKEAELEAHGTNGAALSESQRSLFYEFSAAMAKKGKTLRDAMEFCLQHFNGTEKSCTVQKFTDQFIKDKEDAVTRGDLRKNTLTGDRNRLTKFAKSFAPSRCLAFLGIEP